MPFTYPERKMFFAIIFMIAVSGVKVLTESITANAGNSITRPPSKRDPDVYNLFGNASNGGTYTITTVLGKSTKNLINSSYLPDRFGRRFGNVTKRIINVGQLGNLANIENLQNRSITYPSSETKANIFDLFRNASDGGTYTITTDVGNSTKNLIDSAYLKYLFGGGFGNATKQATNLGQLGHFANIVNLFNRSIKYPSSETNANILHLFGNASNGGTNINDLLANITNGGTYTITTNVGNSTKNLIDSAYLKYLLGGGFGNVTKQTIDLGQLGNFANIVNLFNQSIKYPSSETNANIYNLFGNASNGGTNINDLLANITNGGTYTITTNVGNSTKNLIDSAYLKYLLGGGFGNVTKQTIDLGQLGNFANIVNLFNQSIKYPSSETNANILHLFGNASNGGTNINDLLANITNGGTYTITTNVGNSTKNLIDSAYLKYLLGGGIGNVTKQTIDLGQLGNFANIVNLFNQSIKYPSSETNANILHLFGNASNGGTNINDLLANITNGGTYTITTNVGNSTKNLIDSAYLKYLIGGGFGNVTKQTIDLGQLGNFANIVNLFNQSIKYPSSETNANILHLFGNASNGGTNINDLLANITNGGTYTITTNVGNSTKNLIDSAYLKYLIGGGFGNVTKQTIDLGQLGNFANIVNLFNRSIKYPSSETNVNILHLFGNASNGGTNINDLLANITNGGTYTITTNVGNSTKNLIDSAYLKYLIGGGFGNVTKQTIDLGQLGNFANTVNLFNRSIKYPSSETNANILHLFGNASNGGTNINDLLANITNGGTYTITTNVGNSTKNLIDSAYLKYLIGGGFGNVTKQTIDLGQLGNFANTVNLFNRSIKYPSSETNANILHLFGNASNGGTNINDLLANITNGGTYTITTNVGNSTKNLIDSAYLKYLIGGGFRNVTKQTIDLGQLGNFANIVNLFNRSIKYPSSETNANILHLFGNASNGGTNINDLLANITNGGTYTITTNVGNSTKNLIDSAYLKYLIGGGFGNVTKQTIDLGQLGNFANIVNLFNRSIKYPSSETNVNILHLFGNASNGGTNINDLLANITNGGTYTITTHVGNSTEHLIDNIYWPYLFGNMTIKTSVLGQLGNSTNIGNLFNLSGLKPENLLELESQGQNLRKLLVSDFLLNTKNVSDIQRLQKIINEYNIVFGKLGQMNTMNLSSEINTTIYKLFGNITNGVPYTIIINGGNSTKNLLGNFSLPDMFRRLFGNLTNQTTNLKNVENMDKFIENDFVPNVKNASDLHKLHNGDIYIATNTTNDSVQMLPLSYVFHTVLGNIANLTTYSTFPGGKIYVLNSTGFGGNHVTIMNKNFTELQNLNVSGYPLNAVGNRISGVY